MKTKLYTELSTLSTFSGVDRAVYIGIFFRTNVLCIVIKCRKSEKREEQKLLKPKFANFCKESE